jgi:hypothetical protein
VAHRPPNGSGYPRLYRFLTQSPVAVRLTRDPRLKMMAVRALRLRNRVVEAVRRTREGRT